MCLVHHQGAFSGIFVGFLVSMWLAVGSTLYPPSAETMGVLSYSAQCGSNITVNNITHMEQLSISGLTHNDENRRVLANAVHAVSLCIYCNYQRPMISYFNDSYIQLDIVFKQSLSKSGACTPSTPCPTCTLGLLQQVPLCLLE